MRTKRARPAESATVDTARLMLDTWVRQHVQVTREIQTEVERLQQQERAPDDIYPRPEH